MNISHHIKDYFYFNKSQRNGLVVLLIFVITLLIIRINIASSDIIVLHDSLAIKRFNEFEKGLDKNKKINITVDTIFYFNPNTITYEQWKLLGLSNKQISTISNYLLKGGSFKTKDDLKKIYGVTPQWYNKVEPYILINHSIESTTKTFKKKSLLIDINSADTNELKLLIGIGSILSQRIVKYRNLLGGFKSKEQLLEVYGLSNDVFKTISFNIVVDTLKITKININSATLNELKKHPYIKNIATKIFNYKKATNKNISPYELVKNNVLDSMEYEKIRMYIY